ncbi:MAG: filamentous hemagglutinin, partial [Cyanobacteria bacterium J06643_5]
VDPSNLIAQGCDAFDEEEISEFTVTGRGGLPPSPEEPFSSDGVWEDMRLQDVDGEEEQKKLTSQKDDKEENSSIAKINPATGWEFNEKGEVTLLSASNTTPHKLGSVSQGCRKR